MFSGFYSIGANKGAPRLRIETQRLHQLGLAHGTPLVTSLSANGLELTLTASALGDRHVSRHRCAGGYRPIVEINNHDILQHLQPYEEVRVRGAHGRLVIAPSIRAAHILRQRASLPPYPVVEIFAGGGTMGDAFRGNSAYNIVAAAEIDPTYADEYVRRHPTTHLMLGDVSSIHPDEYPPFVGLVAGIPCTDYAQCGRASKKLAGVPEKGRTGALFLHVLELVATRYPLFVVLENVPAFGNAAAGRIVVKHLKDLGYHVHAFVMRPNEEWNEPTTRDRWVCVATLRAPLTITPPGAPFTGRIADYLDAPDPARDEADARAIATTIAGLERHNARHAALGHRFRMSVLTGQESSCPTIPRNYHKRNSSGAYIATPWGPRPLRLPEILRLHGHNLATSHYSTGVQISGQGVLTRAFAHVADQLAHHLQS